MKVSVLTLMSANVFRQNRVPLPYELSNRASLRNHNINYFSFSIYLFGSLPIHPITIEFTRKTKLRFPRSRNRQRLNVRSTAHEYNAVFELTRECSHSGKR